MLEGSPGSDHQVRAPRIMMEDGAAFCSYESVVVLLKGVRDTNRGLWRMMWTRALEGNSTHLHLLQPGAAETGQRTWREVSVPMYELET